jgi:hypothetical protein
VSLPSGFVDPTDHVDVTEVCAAALARLGWPTLLTVLARLPGVEVVEGHDGGMFRQPTATRVSTPTGWLVLGKTYQLEHVVGGIVLSHQAVPAGEVPGLLAAAVAHACHQTGHVEAASIELTTLRATAEL